jgi:hypothetical protein
MNDHDSIMEEAFNYVNIVTPEAQVSLSTCLKHLALTTHSSRPEKEIKLKFVKVWAAPPSKKARTGTELLKQWNFLSSEQG